VALGEEHLKVIDQAFGNGWRQFVLKPGCSEHPGKFEDGCSDCMQWWLLRLVRDLDLQNDALRSITRQEMRRGPLRQGRRPGW